MRNRFNWLADQPAMAIMAGFLALGAGLILVPRTPLVLSLPSLLLGAIFAGALVLSHRFPIHIQRGTKLIMGSVVVYLSSILLSPLVAMFFVAVGMLLGAFMQRSERDSTLEDILTDTARWMFLVAIASSVGAYGRDHATLQLGCMLLAGAILWTGDILTAPLLLCPIIRDSPWRVAEMVMRETGVTEAYQYLLGLLGALAALEERWAVLLLLVPVVPVYLAFRTTKETQDGTRQVLEAMADAVDLRDPYTGGHSQRVAEYAAQLLREFGLHGPEVELIVSAARVHDIGKIGTPDRILLNDGRLTAEDREVMEEHPVHGEQLLRRYKDFVRGAAIVRHHHERWDGQGYPDGLKGAGVPFGARVVAIADSFDAMTSDRPYRRGMTVERAVGILREGRGSQWDEELVDVFVRSVEKEMDSVPVPEQNLEPVPDLPLSSALINPTGM